MAANILLGPVLSFRGVSKGKWKVSALIGIDESDKAPKFVVDGKAASKELGIAQAWGRQYLRYDLTIKQGDQERKVEYTIEDVDEVWHSQCQERTMRLAWRMCRAMAFRIPAASES